MGNKRIEKSIFRLYTVPKTIVDDFEKKFEELRYEIYQFKKPIFKKNLNRYTIKINLTNKMDYKKIIPKMKLFIRKHKLAASSYGVWVSLFTYKESDGLTVPKYVVDFFKEVGGNLDFLFTTCKE